MSRGGKRTKQKRGRVEVVCENCGRTFAKKRVDLQRTKYNFCSRECYKAKIRDVPNSGRFRKDQKSWHKGLTIADERVRKRIEKAKETKLKLIAEGKLDPFKNFGIPRWSEEELEVLKRKYPSCGVNIPELSHKSRGTIKTMAYQLGIRCNRRGNFTPIPSEDLAYVLGVMFSDGSSDNSTVKLLTVEKDFAVGFFKALKGCGLKPRIRINTRKQYTQGFAYVVSASNVSLARWCKNLNPASVEHIIKGYEPSFLSGIIDGDGDLPSKVRKRGCYVCLRIRQKKRGEERINFYTNLLRRLGCNPAVFEEKNGSHCVVLSPQEEVWELFQKINPAIRYKHPRRKIESIAQSQHISS